MMYEAEESVISCLIARPESIEKIYGILSPDMFESAVLGRIYLEYQRAFDSEKEITVTEVTQAVAADGFKDYEINEAVTKCVKRFVLSADIGGYANSVVKHHKKKCIDLILSRVVIQEGTVDDQIETLIGELESLRSGDESDGRSVAEITKNLSGEYFKEKDNKLILFGDDGIDNLTGGFQGGDLIILGARPGVGKSALATQWAWIFAEQGLRVGYFNCEMQEEALFERFVASRTGIPVTRVRRAISFLSDEEIKYRRAVEELSKQDRIIIFTGAKKVSDIRRIQKEGKFDILIIDYIQLLIVEDRYRGNRVAEVGELSRSIKETAMYYKIPVLALSQLSRASESRSTKEPQLSDLRESGSIEQDASVVFFLWNMDESDLSKKGFKTAKSRNGVIGQYDLIFDGATMKFTAANKATPFD